ncbi:MAG: hypothetical protein IT562_05770 [Alphaproteobacteria bacterium]|nr:hypothetical protein [Alphaproteobacteria bacterium]
MALAISRARAFESLFRIAEDDSQVTAQLYAPLSGSQIAGKRVHDVNIVATMLANGIGTILTDNASDFAGLGAAIQVVSLTP